MTKKVPMSVTIDGTSYTKRSSSIAIQLDYERSTGESLTLLTKNPLLTKLAAYHAAALEGNKGERISSKALLEAYTEDEDLIQTVANIISDSEKK